MLAVLGFSYLFGCFLGGFLTDGVLWIAALAFGLLFLGLLPWVRRLPLVAAGAGACTAALLACLAVSIFGAVDYAAMGEEEMAVLVEECDYSGTTAKYTVSVQGGELAGRKILFGSYEALPLKPGDLLEGSFSLRIPEDRFGFSERTKLRAKGISFLGTMGEYRVTGREENSYPAARERTAGYFSRVLERILPLDAAYLTEAMLLGDGSNIGSAVKDGFRQGGGSHLLVVSGLHLSVLVSTLSGLLFFLGRKSKLRTLLLMAGVLAFMAVTGFRYSVLRAGIMSLLFLAAEALGREQDSLDSLAAAALVICLINPYAAGDIGFLLSFSATLGILMFYPPLRASLHSRLGKLGENRALGFFTDQVCVSLCACVYTVPLSMYLFGSFSLLSVFTSTLLAVPCSIIIGLGLVFCLFGGFAAPAFQLPALLSVLLCKFTYSYVESLPEWAYVAAQGYTLLAPVGILLVILLCRKFGGGRGTGLLGAVCCGAIAAAAVFLTLSDSSVTLSLANHGARYRVELQDGSESLALGSGTSSGEGSPHSLREDLEWSSPHCRVSAEDGVVLVEAHGRQILLMEDARPRAPRSCDILLTRYGREEVSAPLTVLASEEEVKDALTALPAGNYADPEGGLRIRVLPDGQVKLERF